MSESLPQHVVAVDAEVVRKSAARVSSRASVVVQLAKVGPYFLWFVLTLSQRFATKASRRRESNWLRQVTESQKVIRVFLAFFWC